MSIGLPPSPKRRRIDLISDNTNVGFVVDNKSSLHVSSTSTYYNIGSEYTNNHSEYTNKIMETRSILEHIHSFLELSQILLSRTICKSWNKYFQIRIQPSQLSLNGSDCNIFPLYMREMFNKSIGQFENWLLFFICEYRNIEFKLQCKIKSTNIYPENITQNHSYRFNYISYLTNNSEKYKLYCKYLTIFICKRHLNANITLHNILFSWLRGLKYLSLYWLKLYNIKNLQNDLIIFHKELSSNYIEVEYNTIPILNNLNLIKFDFLSSYLGLITLNGDFELFYKLLNKIKQLNDKLITYFPKQHFPNHIYEHKHTFGFGYNIYGLCKINLIDTALQICDIPRSVCSLKIIRFVMQPHILVNIQSDLCKNKYILSDINGNILNISLNKRIILLKKLCFYFDLCSTINSSNVNRSNINEYLVYSQLKKGFGNNNNQNIDSECIHNDNKAHLLHNFQLWKRYILLCHLKYFIGKYKNKLNINNYISYLLNIKPKEINNILWNDLNDLCEKVIIIYPELKNILNIKTSQNYSINYNEIEKYLKKQYDQYCSSIILLDCIGDIYQMDEHRDALKIMNRRGALNINEYQILKQCILSSPHIRQHFLSSKYYDLDKLYNAIENISFHDNQININDDNDKNIGITLKHGQ